MRRVLVVSPHFPPTNAPDHQRVRMSLPYFREFGWAPTILAVDAADVEGHHEPLLANMLPADVPVHRVRAWPAGVTRVCGLGNIAYRAWFQLARAGARLLRDEKFDLVYFSTTQFIATLLGSRWRKQFGTPYIIDVQDPWRTDYYERRGAPAPPGGWKYRFARWQAARLEERAWRDASGFISVSPAYLTQLRARYPWFDGKPAAVIPFGASETDFEFVRRHPEIPAAFSREPGVRHLVSVGAIGPVMHPALHTLFAGLAAWRSRATEWRLRLHFVGTSYAPAERAAASVRPIAQVYGMDEGVVELPHRIGYLNAIQTMLHADAVLLLGSDEPGYSPSKIATCFLARRPVLAVMPPGSVASSRVESLKFARMIAAGTEGAPGQLRDYFEELIAGSAWLLPATRDEARFQQEDTARACTRRQCSLFDEALATPARE